MKIISIETWIEELPLLEAYTVSYATFNKAVNLFCKIETNTGIIGYGCAAPDINVTGETTDKCLITVNNTIAPIINGSDPLRIIYILEKIRHHLLKMPSVMAMVDMALYDILGKTANLPLWKLLGGYKTSIPTSITIGICDVKETTKKAKLFIKQGFRCLKIKGGLCLEDDIERILKTREVVGPNIKIRFDANQGYDTRMTFEFIKKTDSAKLELIEQPTPKENLTQLGKITNRATVPIMADESMITLQDAFRLVRKNLVNMINIKLMKVGGINAAANVNAVAKAAKVDVMIGCMDESALSIAAGLHFALSRQNIKFADLDSHLDINNDPFKGAVLLKNGVLTPTDNPGLF